MPEESLRSFPHRRRWPLAPLALAALGLALAGLLCGEVALPPQAVLRSLVEGLRGAAASDPLASATVLQLRLPRVALALLIGAALAQSGAAMQGLLRNPLAEPGLIGVSSGAALAAAVLYVALPQASGTLPLTLAAFAGGLAAFLIAAALAPAGTESGVGALLLAGLAVNTLAGAGIGLLASLAPAENLRQLAYWSFGSLAKAGWADIAWAAPAILFGMGWIAREARTLDALLLGDAEAGHLGIAVRRRRMGLLLAIVLSVASCTALAGLIGFVGLIVPQLARLICGPAHTRLLPASALAGAALLSGADLFCRLAWAPQELPVGVVTALLGAPLFLMLLRRRGAGA